jgi:hypothetical protein
MLFVEIIFHIQTIMRMEDEEQIPEMSFTPFSSGAPCSGLLCAQITRNHQLDSKVYIVFLWVFITNALARSAPCLGEWQELP